MKTIYFICIPIMLYLACQQTTMAEHKNHPNSSSIEPIAPQVYDSSLKCPDFFKQIVLVHTKNFYQKDSLAFLAFCKDFYVSPNDSSIRQTYYSFVILHALFTSSNASNGSKGPILNMPYLWHWVQPNPRHEIRLTKNNQKLSTVKPPSAFGKYNSFADIDRTPALFFSDMFASSPKYYLNPADTFSTFGWCSEREMAFVCLMDLLGYQGAVIVNGNHSWSEFLVKARDINKKVISIKVRVDNTFNQLEWFFSDGKETTPQQGTGLKYWYNKKAHDDVEKQQIKDIKVAYAVSSDIENRICKHLNSY